MTHDGVLGRIVRMSRSPCHILLTGPPRCGKTTVVQHVVKQLADMRLAGFYTRELRRRGQRVGFEVVARAGGRHESRQQNQSPDTALLVGKPAMADRQNNGSALMSSR